MVSHKHEMVVIDETKFYLDLRTWQLFLEIWAEGLMQVNVMVSKVKNSPGRK